MTSTAASLARPDSVAGAESSAPVKTTQAAKAERLANIERLRVLAMFEIVRYHDHDDRLLWVGGLGLPTFLLLTNLFNCTLTEKRGTLKFLADKRDRLFQPWLFWSLLYASVLAITGLRHAHGLGETLSWNMILAGTSSHLWFVPFAIFSAFLVAGAQWSTRRLPHRPTAYAAALLGLAVLLTFGLMPKMELEPPLPQWMLSLPSSFFGFALGRLVLASNGQPKTRDMLPLAAVALVLAFMFGVWTHNMLIWRYAVSMLLVFVAFLRPGTLDPVSRFMSPLLFGIYLVHPLIGHRMLVKIPGMEHSQLFFVADFIVTAVVVYLLKKTPMRRFV